MMAFPRSPFVAMLWFLFLPPLVALADWKPVWQPVTPEELAETRPKIDPDAAAEVVFKNIEVDDADLPVRRQTHYVRYKIYVPDRAIHLTRLSELETFDEKDVELSARLTLADGTTKVFGKESIRERPLIKSGAESSLLARIFADDYRKLQEKFLAVTGIEPGAVLEYQWRTKHRANLTYSTSFLTGWLLQPEELPVRVAKITFLPPTGKSAQRRVFLFNTDSSKVQAKRDDKKDIFTVTAQDLPAHPNEPLAGSMYDRAPTAFLSYEAIEFEIVGRNVRSIDVDPKKNGPWATQAVRSMLLTDEIVDTEKYVEKYAKELVQGAPTPLEKAKRIHEKISSLQRGYARALKTRKPEDVRYLSWGRDATLEDMIKLADQHPHLPINENRYLWLELSLDRAAGLNAKLIDIPTRKIVRFDIRAVSAPFLENDAIAVQIDNKWYVSDPRLNPSLPFGVMPWYSQGDVGLLAQEGDQTFIPLNPTLAKDSLITTTGELQLESDGTLHGTIHRKITGQPAFNLRQRLLDQETAAQQEKVRDQLKAELPNMTVKILKIDGVDGVGTPVEVVFEVEYPGFAVMAKDRLIIRPAMLRGANLSPFSAATRRKAVQFPYEWGEIDDLTVTLPAGYAPDQSLATAAPIFEKNQFYFKIALNFNPAQSALRARREFVLLQPDWLPAQYPQLKGWFDAMAGSDQLEIIFKRSTATAAQTAP